MRSLRHLGGFVVLCVLVTGFAACSGGASSSGGADGASSTGSGGSGGDAGSGGSGGDSSNGSGGDSSSNGSGGDTSSSNSSSSNGSGGDTSSNSSSSNTTVGLVMGDPIAIEDYGTAIGEAFCPTVTPCCSEMFDLTVNDADCAVTLGALFGEDYQSADPANYNYDPDLAGDCVATAEQVYQTLNCDFDAAENTALDETVGATCDRVFTGVLEPGEACSSDIECAADPGQDPSCEELNFGDGYEVCVIEWRATVGEDCYWTCSEEGVVTSCSGSGSGSAERPALRGECYTNDGLFCGSEGVCERLSGIGETCTNDSNCRRGYCDSGECMAPVGQGMDCVTDSWCAQDLYCNDQLCAPKLADGVECTLSSECLSGLCSDGTCGDDGSSGDLAIALICGLISGEL